MSALNIIEWENEVPSISGGEMEECFRSGNLVTVRRLPEYVI